MNARLPQTAVDADQAIGQIAVQLPGATAIFRRLKLDFCCGGQASLRQAAADKGLDLPAVLQELSALHRSDEAPQARNPPELIDHIIAQGFAAQQLPALYKIMPTVEDVLPALATEPAPALAKQPGRT